MAIAAFAAALVPLAVYTGVGLALPRGPFWGRLGLPDTVDYGLLMPSGFRAPWFLHSLVWLGGALLLYGMFAVLRPAPAAGTGSRGERRRVRQRP